MEILSEQERQELLSDAAGTDGSGQLYYPTANADPNQFNILKVRLQCLCLLVAH